MISFLTPAEHTAQLLPHKIYNFVFVALKCCVSFYFCKCVVDDGQEHAHQPDINDQHVHEEKRRTQNSFRVLKRVEIKITQSKRKQRFHGTYERTITWE